MTWPILSVTTFLPLAGALFIMFACNDGRLGRATARWVALWTTLVTFAVSLLLVYHFDAGSAGFQFTERYRWLGISSYHVGVDGISLPLVILTTVIMPISILASWTYGLGRAVAFTSDAGFRYASNWTGWANYGSRSCSIAKSVAATRVDTPILL